MFQATNQLYIYIGYRVEAMSHETCRDKLILDFGSLQGGGSGWSQVLTSSRHSSK